MERRSAARTALVGFIGVLALALVADPVAAQQGFDSTTEELIRTLNDKLLIVALPITVLVEGILLYTVYRFRNNEEPKPTEENRRLEITWTVATAIVLVFVGVASYGVLAQPDVTTTRAMIDDKPSDAVEVKITGYQWYWNVEYAGENVSIEQARTIYLPTDRPVYLNVTAGDVIHAIHVPGLGLKQDAIPGQHNVIRTRITSTGEYQLYCAEYCGAGHSKMLATVEVVSPGEFETWLEEQRGG